MQIAFGLIAAYNAVVFLSWVLAGYGMFLLARWVMGTAAIGPRLPIGDARAGYVAAIVAGLVYAGALSHGTPPRPHAGDEPAMAALLCARAAARPARRASTAGPGCAAPVGRSSSSSPACATGISCSISSSSPA